MPAAIGSASGWRGSWAQRSLRKSTIITIFAWEETHYGEKMWVVRKGATPAFPGQKGFVGGSMGDDAVIVEGVDSDESRKALYSTVHGAGRVMSRTAAAGRKHGRRRTGGAVTQQMMMQWVREKGVGAARGRGRMSRRIATSGCPRSSVIMRRRSGFCIRSRLSVLPWLGKTSSIPIRIEGERSRSGRRKLDSKRSLGTTKKKRGGSDSDKKECRAFY